MDLYTKQNLLIEDLQALGDWSARFTYLIELGAKLPPMPAHLKVCNNLISTCASRTYFCTAINNGCIYIYGCSNASIPAGLIYLAYILFNGVSLIELKQTQINFHIKTGLSKNLTSNRSLLLNNIINKLSLI